ncbi:MAG: hypothetical protein Q9213_001456 [Squamulea squamosa]
MTTLLNDACEGITAFPNTLIGMFFKQTAVQELCAGIQVTTVSADGPDPSTTAIAESTSTIPSLSSSKSTSTVVETATMTDTSTSEPTTTLSTQTSVVASSTGHAGQNPVNSAPTATADGSSVNSPSATQGSSANPDRNNGATGADTGDKNGNGGTVLEAASTGNVRSMHVLSPMAALICVAQRINSSGKMHSTWLKEMVDRSPSTRRRRMAETTVSDNDGSSIVDTTSLASIPTTDLNAIETTLDRQQDFAFSSLIRLCHLPPVVATAGGAIYRATLGSNTAIRGFAERNGYDTLWFYWVCAIGIYGSLFVSEIVMAILERFIGLGKGVLWIPMVGIPIWKAGKRKGFRETMEFFFGEGMKVKEDKAGEVSHAS